MGQTSDHVTFLAVQKKKKKKGKHLSLCYSAGNKHDSCALICHTDKEEIQKSQFSVNCAAFAFFIGCLLLYKK